MSRKSGANRSGLDFENAIAAELNRRGAPARRIIGRSGEFEARIEGAPLIGAPLLIECKEGKQPPNIRRALEQCRSIAEDNYPLNLSVAICRTKGKPRETVVAMYWDEFLTLILGEPKD